jgi:hypothetical protein
MKTKVITILTILAVTLPVLGQEKPNEKDNLKSTQQTQQSAHPQTTKAALGFGLEDGTPIKLRISRNLSSADAQVGETVDFEVLEDIKAGEVVVVPRGSTAWGTVTEAQPKRRMGRAGKLNVNIDTVRLADGEKAALRAVKEVQGGGHVGAMTGAIVATSIVFFPAAPLFLLMHGKDITIPKGTELTAYINGDVALDPAKFRVKTDASPQAAAPQPTELPGTPGVQAGLGQAATELSNIEISSTPDGADITIDGKFVGNTPSSVKLAPGDHTILIEKSGFKSWQRTLTASPSGNVKVDAALDKEPRLSVPPI